MTSFARFGFQFHRFEPLDVLSIEKHEPDGGNSLVDLEGVTREDGSLDDYSVGIIVEETPRGQQGEFPVILLCEDEDWCRGKGDGGEGGHDDDPVPEVSLVLVFTAVGVLAEDGTGGKPSPADLEDEPRFGLDWQRAREVMSPHGNVDDRHSVLVREETGEDEAGPEVWLEVSAHSADDQSHEPPGLRSRHGVRQNSLLGSAHKDED